jgi:acyl-CoA synthetase (AMP-forming)/AMP-acid ligase II
MSLISGIPSWLRMYFEKLVDRAGKPVGEIFPDFSLLVYGGLNYEPYRQAFAELIGRHIDTVELYPASEGFLAYQDGGPGEGLLLNINSGIFFEFIPVEEVQRDHPSRIPLEGVELGKDYAIILSNNAGLWAYNLGDTVRFVSLDPYRIFVTGRVSQFISAFGEHVIASEVEESLAEVCSRTGVRVDEFTVAPQVNPPTGRLPHHQWLIEFKHPPDSLQEFSVMLDQEMCKRNPYYNDLITGHVLEPLHITSLRKGTFKKYLASKGKLGGQNKVPHLSDSRDMAEELIHNPTSTSPVSR